MTHKQWYRTLFRKSSPSHIVTLFHKEDLHVSMDMDRKLLWPHRCFYSSHIVDVQRVSFFSDVAGLVRCFVLQVVVIRG